MYCSTCGMATARGLSYCNYCGAKLTAQSVDTATKPSEMKRESIVWAMVAVLVFGFVGIVFLLMAMKMVGLNAGQILGFTILSFLIMLLVEGVFISQLLGRKRRTDEVLSREQSTKELNEAQARVLPEPVPSVTEHTTRAFDPIYNERQNYGKS